MRLRRNQRSISDMVGGTGSTVEAPNRIDSLTGGVNRAMNNGKGLAYIAQYGPDGKRFHYYRGDDIVDMILGDGPEVPPSLILMWDEREIVATVTGKEFSHYYRVGPVW